MFNRFCSRKAYTLLAAAFRANNRLGRLQQTRNSPGVASFQNAPTYDLIAMIWPFDADDGITAFTHLIDTAGP